MHTNEKKLTLAQAALLDFIESTTPGTVYRSLSTVVILGISPSIRKSNDDPSPEPPTEKAIEAIYFTLELMERVVGLLERMPPPSKIQGCPTGA